MKFRKEVQDRKVTWPTQRKFDPKLWALQAEQLADDEADKALAQVGLWIAETLEPIRESLASLPLWTLPLYEFTRYAIGLCNHDFATFLKKQPVDDKGQYITLVADEQILRLFDQNLYGSGKASDLIESSLDAVDRILSSPPRTNQSGFHRKPELIHLAQSLNTAVVYQMAEDIFYQTLWLDWRIQQHEKAWFVCPEDAETEQRWEASWRRFAELRIQEQGMLLDTWKTDGVMRTTWYQRSGGVSIFGLEKRAGLLDVHHIGRAMPENPPTMLQHQTTAFEAYYRPLIEDPLPLLNGHSVLNILTALAALGDIAEVIMKSFPVQEPIEILAHTIPFSPIVLHRSLVAALGEACDMEKQSTDLFLKEFTWREGKSLWFHPLVKVSTGKGPGYLFAILPLVAPSIYRVVDYWLSTLNLPISRRGELFEEQIATELLDAAREGKVDNHFAVVHSKTLRSRDGASEEEIDVLFLLHDLTVVAEAKCQVLPATPTDRHNYMMTLTEGAQQAKRKATWVEANLGVAVAALGVGADLLSGHVQPIVITNHSIGAGFVLDGVPILDLLLLEEYLSRPYLAQGQFSSSGLAVQVKGERFYDTPKQMGDHFPEYAAKPPFVQEYFDALKPSWQHFPIRADKPVLRLQYLIQVEEADTVEHEADANRAAL